MSKVPSRLAVIFIAFALLVTSPVFAAEDAPAVLVTTTTVVAQPVTDSLSVFGVLDPDSDQVSSLSLPHAGLINRVWVRVGQRVKKGDQLVEVITDPDARMQYLQAQGAVDFAGQELQRQMRLQQEQLATKSDVEGARKTLNDSQAVLDALQQRGINLAQDIMHAPIDGIITQLDVAQGQRLQADTAALLIAAEQNLVARLGVEPEDIQRVQVGAPVKVTSVFEPNISIETVIREKHAMINPNTRLVEVLAAIPAQHTEHLLLGSRILARIQLASRTALLVPRNAVLGDADGSYLFTLQDNIAKRQTVQTGIEEDGLVEVTGDVRAGDVIVTSGNYELADGMVVRETP